MKAAAAIMFAALVSCSSPAPTPANQSDASQNARSEASAPGTPKRTGYATVDGGRIYYQVYGDLAAGRTPLLVLHGSFMSADTMRPLFQPFIATRPVIAIDARGHGRTGDLPGPITQELLADDAAAVLSALRVPRADVIGYSMGGTTALYMAVRHPQQVGKQIILAAPSRVDGWYPEVLAGMARATPAMFAGTPVEAEYRRLSPNPERFSTYVEEVTALERDYVIPEEAVRGIAGKTMIILGDADGVRLEHAIALFRLRGGGDRESAGRGFIAGSPRARLAILPATSHIGHMAEADRIGAIATAFLDDRPPPRATGFFEGMDQPPRESSPQTR